MNLEQRVDRLEGELGDGDGCELCTGIRVDWPDNDGQRPDDIPDDLPSGGSVWRDCAGCGRRYELIVIKWPEEF